MDFLFNPAANKVDDEAFWCKDTSLEIRIEGTFVELTDSEKSTFDDNGHSTSEVPANDARALAGRHVLYDGTGSAIDTSNGNALGTAVHASYVILRRFTILDVKELGIGLQSRLSRGKWTISADVFQRSYLARDCLGATLP